MSTYIFLSRRIFTLIGGGSHINYKIIQINTNIDTINSIHKFNVHPEFSVYSMLHSLTATFISVSPSEQTSISEIYYLSMP